jgi:hypothetical protein
MSEKLVDLIALSQSLEIQPPIQVEESFLNAAKEQFAAYEKREGYQNYNKTKQYIIELIASSYSRDKMIKDPRSLINSMVKVGGKGWTSY